MVTATLTINGKDYEVRLTEEQAAEITAPKKVTGFEREECHNIYYCITDTGHIYPITEHKDDGDNNYYASANYYSDRKLAEWCARSDTLNRKMRRWAAEHNTERIDWTDDNSKWYIYYDFKFNEINTDDNATCCSTERVYFQDYPTAKAAITEFGEEIKWLSENRPKWF